MKIKIKDSLATEANSNMIRAYMLSKALKKEDCTDDDIKKVYGLTDEDFDAAIDVLIADGSVEEK